MRWRYVDAQGNTLCWIYRFDIAEGKKQFAPVTYGILEGKEGWHFKALPTPRPLYNLNGIATHPDAIVIVCEGEKSADATAKLFPAPHYVTTTAMNGAQSMHNANWSPLAGRKVWLWPDNADDGFEAMKKAAECLAAAGAFSIDELKLEWFNQLPDGKKRQLPKKWDAADAIEDGYQAGDMLGFIADASNFLFRDVAAVPAVHPSNSNGFSGTSAVTAENADVTATDIPSEDQRPCYRIFDKMVKTEDKKYRPGV